VDDDCDGTIDEDADTACFTGSAGCEKGDEPGFTCQGICRAGNQTCRDGMLVGACVGQVVTSALGERCRQLVAADDDCDGKVDEDCPCSGESSQACYTGPESTAGVGTCRNGEQRCLLGLFGVCQGQILPAAETCENSGQDNDCDGTRDNVVEGGTCLTGMPGRCARGTLQCAGDRTTCAPNNPPRNEQCNSADDDCDGRTDEDFDLQNNEAMCGSCFRSCNSSQQCCGGACASVRTDAANCGQCGHACAAGEVCSAGVCRCAGNTTLCDGQCIDTSTNGAHCGGCNRPCTGGHVCAGSICRCPDGQIECGGQCTAPVCGGGCACGTGRACCGDQCVDTRTSEEHCGGCDSPCAGQPSCIDGVCACEVGSRCGTACVNLNLDATHCGSCERACAEGQSCVSGDCQ
jgi:hypothetical protein